MVDETRFKSKLEKLDSANRTCILFLFEEIKRLRVYKHKPLKECMDNFHLFDKKLCEFIDAWNITVELVNTLKSFSEQYEKAPKLIVELASKEMDFKIDQMKEVFMEYFKVLDEKVDELSELRDSIERLLNERNIKKIINEIRLGV